MSYKDAEKNKQYYKAYRKANPERLRAIEKAYYLANYDKIRARKKAYREVNKEKIKIKHKIWQKINPAKNREYSRKRRALERTTQVEPINEKKVYLRDGWICQHCKKRVNKKFSWPHPMCASLDHITPLNKGGTHTHDNVQLAHLGCNLRKYINILPQGEQLRMF